MKTENYRVQLRALSDWDSFLLKESGLPGPRANLELVQAVADEGTLDLFQRYLIYTPDRASTNSSEVFLAVCGVVGLGRLLAEGDLDQLAVLRECANDPRWRVREAVAMGLQRWGDVDMPALLKAMSDWVKGTLLERRAAAAALCEPRLLHDPRQAKRVLKLLDTITTSIVRDKGRKAEDFKTLRQALGYCWSVAVVALPGEGKPAMEKWLVTSDPDVAWIMRENLKKNRLQRMDAKWVKEWSSAVVR
jgi:HEAT repeat protein